jgi:hypothetical protein
LGIRIFVVINVITVIKPIFADPVQSSRIRILHGQNTGFGFRSGSEKLVLPATSDDLKIIELIRFAPFPP